MSTATTEDEIRDYLTTGVDGKPGIPAGLAEPIVEYLANMGLSLEDVKGLSIEDFSLAYQAVHAARTEMDDIFQGDAKAKLAYMIRYRKKHCGLAFPVPIDLPC